jgi:Holliday junction resolvase-like predicted endonuclease
MSRVHGEDGLTDQIRFVLSGRSLELSRADVEQSLVAVVPGAIQKHAVKIGNVWFPVRQAFGAATGIAPTDFTSHTARRHLVSLGFELRGEIEARSNGVRQPTRESNSRSASAGTGDESWHTEASVQAAVVTWLVGQGWSILSVADTATREHGVDVVATRGGERVGIEVKGFPSRSYADPRRAAEAKRTQPSTQAGHWYAQAVLAAMRLRGRSPEMRSVIALPDFPRYRSLHEETRRSLEDLSIEVWWVEGSGAVRT